MLHAYMNTTLEGMHSRYQFGIQKSDHTLGQQKHLKPCKFQSKSHYLGLFLQVSPLYHSALEALSSVQKNDVLEVMSYREPPTALTPIFNALCMLFDRPQT